MSKSRRTRKNYTEGYWPVLRTTADIIPDRVAIGYGIHYIVEDKNDWYFNVSDRIWDTREEAIESVLHKLEFYGNQGAAVSWSINPIYPTGV
jgi:hypothetical protein